MDSGINMGMYFDYVLFGIGGFKGQGIVKCGFGSGQATVVWPIFFYGWDIINIIQIWGFFCKGNDFFVDVFSRVWQGYNVK